MSSAAKKLQSKLFGNGVDIPSIERTGDPNLTINIPKVVVDPPDDKTRPATRTYRDQSSKNYRQLVLDRLGTSYEGVERYRLAQDAAKERHWKRWGPYLAERQWVSVDWVACILERVLIATA